MNEKPMSPLLIMMLQHIQEEAQKKINKAIELSALELKLPEGTKADITKGIWIMPSIAPE